ncbi:type I methionyl aminopeptidase [Pseudoalteromonas luteoviolacea]|uniref:type I methionyl aminopeptidase n=1 Tax=Pseudoalteromonas luteoviolacea TaxID=43657 RepID=UPI001B3609F7|nr:type I methionyl aminopeptidase [Pseudoalteromonas luteoviolacea]MBQ4810170.1 type I methionyl aminopeptidase [Pseudoalteromonas luteoviolacea]
MKPVIIKNDAHIRCMRESGALLASVFKALDEYIEVGMTTMDVNDFVEAYITDKLGAIASTKGQYGYPYAINVSTNEVVCHGMPKVSQKIKSSDIINIDVTLKHNGYLADSSKMYVMQEASPLAKKLAKETYQAMWEGIKLVKPGAKLGDIGHAIQSYAERRGYSIVREFCGHGIGSEMHEGPDVLHFGKRDTGLVLQPGMTFTIEPMVNQGSHKVKTLKDGWTVVTKDKKLSAQWEHTILVTENGYEVLTLRYDESLPCD